MSIPSRLQAFAAALALLACPVPTLAQEHARMELVWVSATGQEGGAGQIVPALLTLPPGWMTGDAAAVVLADAPWPGRARERLAAALLEEAAAVLELDVGAARGFSP